MQPVRVLLMGKFWNGETSLPVAYWVYGYLVPIGVGVLLGLMDLMPETGTAMAKSFLMVLLALWVFWSVGTWRSASKYQGPKAWGILVKAHILLPPVFLVFGLAISSFASGS